jgi:hypothetical protein
MNGESARLGAPPNYTQPQRSRTDGRIIGGAPALLFIAGDLDPFDAERCWQVQSLIYATGQWRRRRVGGTIRSNRITRSWPASRIREVRWAADEVDRAGR